LIVDSGRFRGCYNADLDAYDRILDVIPRVAASSAFRPEQPANGQTAQ
jgi:hypothetical protein